LEENNQSQDNCKQEEWETLVDMNWTLNLVTCWNLIAYESDWSYLVIKDLWVRHHPESKEKIK